MAVDVVTELDHDLRQTKAALRQQAETMLELLLQFEAQIDARIALAEQRIAAVRSTNGREHLS